MNIDTTNVEPVYGYSNNGKHRAPMSVIIWLAGEIAQTNQESSELFEAWQNTGGTIEEIEYRESQATLNALLYVQRYLENKEAN